MSEKKKALLLVVLMGVLILGGYVLVAVHTALGAVIIFLVGIVLGRYSTLYENPRWFWSMENSFSPCIFYCVKKLQIIRRMS